MESTTSPKLEANRSYNFVEIEYSDLSQYPNGIDDLYDRTIDGFHIRNVFSHQEVDRFLGNLSTIREDEYVHPYSGLTMFPRAFSQVDQSVDNSPQKLQDYFQNNTRLWNGFEDQFGVDFQGRVKATLEGIGGNRTAIPPKGNNGVGIYTPATFKILNPEVGHLVPHCGNHFHVEFPSFFEHLGSFSDIGNQLSYFVMLKQPEEGGELVLYGLEWQDATERLEDKYKLRDKNGHVHALETEVQQQKIKPSAGDMIVFSGGCIWHRVAHVKGTIPRVTIGGFLTRSLDDREIHFWS